MRQFVNLIIALQLFSTSINLVCAITSDNNKPTADPTELQRTSNEGEIIPTNNIIPELNYSRPSLETSDNLAAIPDQPNDVSQDVYDDYPLHDRTHAPLYQAGLDRKAEYKTVDSVNSVSNGSLMEKGPNGTTTKDIKEDQGRRENKGIDTVNTKDENIAENYPPIIERLNLTLKDYRFIKSMQVIYIFLIALLIDLLIRLVTRKVSYSRDRSVRHFLESVYRSISIIGIAITFTQLMLYLCGVFINESIENYFPIINRPEGRCTSTGVFDLTDLVQRCQLFLMVYILNVAYISFLSWFFYKDLKKLDTKPEEYITTHKTSLRETEYSVLRCEFVDTVSIRTVKGFDPKYYNFMEYLRSCILKIASRLVYFPKKIYIVCITTTVVYGILIYSKIDIRPEYFFLALSNIASVLLIFVSWKAFSIVRQLVPADMKKYLYLQKFSDSKVYAEYDELTPQYKAQDIYKTVKGGYWSKIFRGTKYPTRHEQLFFFWKRGPTIMISTFEFSVILGLLSISQLIYGLTTENEYPFKKYIIIGVIIFYAFQFAYCLKQCLWYCTLATCTGKKIQEDVLIEVWDLERAQTVSRIVSLIDTLRIEAMLYELSKPDSVLKLQIQNQVNSISPEYLKKIIKLWDSLEPDDDQCLNVCQLYTFLRGQGLNIQEENSIYEWFNIFDRNHEDRIVFEEFKFIVFIAKHLVGKPLDEHSIIELLNQKYNFPLDAVDVVNVYSLKRLFKELQLHKQWNGTQTSRLLYLVGADLSNGISLERFVYGLKRYEVATIAPITQAVDEMSNLASNNMNTIDEHHTLSF